MTPPQPDADEAQRKAESLYSELAALAGGLAHEIRNPLSTIRLNMELLAEDLANPQTPRERRALTKIERVEKECQRLEDLLNDFLNFVRPQTYHLDPADLNAEVDRVLDFFRPKAEEQGIEVVRYLDPDLPMVLLDREPFQSALLNLVLNAQQAMTEGGQLTVRTRSFPAGVALELIDTGCGMDPATQAQIFETFFSTKPGGSGLGLPTVRNVVEAHHGRINVESEPGRGTRFTILLPVPPRLAAPPPVIAIQ
jgi:signal transduction histidine kinase